MARAGRERFSVRPFQEELKSIPRCDISKLGAWLQYRRDEASKSFELSLSILLGAMLRELNQERKRRNAEAGIETNPQDEAWFEAQVEGGQNALQ